MFEHVDPHIALGKIKDGNTVAIGGAGTISEKSVWDDNESRRGCG